VLKSKTLLMRILKKALLLWGAFFIACSSLVYAQCGDSSSARLVSVAHVYDGDTVRLADGRRVRLIGLNTPETGKEGFPSEYLADEASRKLREMLSNGNVKLALGVERQDRYKRWLGHLYVNDELVSERLLREGLAFHINIPPNTSLAHCLKQAEIEAIGASRGLWSRSPWREVSSLDSKEVGFRLLKGQVSAIKAIKSGWIVEIDDLLALKINRQVGEELLWFLNRPASIGVVVGVRGWVRPKADNAPSHYQPWFMSLSHKAHLKFEFH
jgi:micrococcal nuclease